MRVLVAGGAGFLGGTLCARLLDRGDEVVCVDNLITGTAENIKAHEGRSAFSFVEADVSAPLHLDGPFQAIVNLACPASPADFGSLALEILEVGSRGVANLLDLARVNGARFLQASTSEIYGEPQLHPQPETYWGNVNPIGVRSVYDEAKRFGEALTMAVHRRYGLEVRLARIFNTYGPGMRIDDGRVVSNFAIQALRGEPLTVYGDGTQTRSFCYVDDLATGLLALLDSGYTGPVNVGSDEELDMLSVARLVLEVSGSTSAITFAARPADDPSVRRPDLTVARRELGWAPTTPFREGLARTIEWFASRSGR
jgi:dTDP-glucose 4,6-dehydratase